MSSTTEENQQHRRTIRSYVKREGRMSIAQKRALTDSWPEFGLEAKDSITNLAALFNNANPCVLEIGFGMGQSFIVLAERYPNKNFIGIEVHRPGVGAVLHAAKTQQLQNVRVFCEDAKQVLTQAIPDNSLEQVLLFFPDPWPKKRHHKRRLLQYDVACLIVTKLMSGGVFHMATDWQHYAEQSLELLDTVPQLVNTAGAGQYALRPDWRPETKYERRGVNKGHGVWDLIYQKE